MVKLQDNVQQLMPHFLWQWISVWIFQWDIVLGEKTKSDMIRKLVMDPTLKYQMYEMGTEAEVGCQVNKIA